MLLRYVRSRQRKKSPIDTKSRDTEREVQKRTLAWEMTDPQARTLNLQGYVPQGSSDLSVYLPRAGSEESQTHGGDLHLAPWQGGRARANSSHLSQPSFMREQSSLTIITARTTIKLNLYTVLWCRYCCYPILLKKCEIQRDGVTQPECQSAFH